MKDTHQSSVKFPKDEHRKIEEKANELELSVSEYIRQRFRTGELVWDGEYLDAKQMKSAGDLSATRNYGQEAISTSDESQVKKAVLDNLPEKSSGDGLTNEQLKKSIFGTEEERNKLVENIIEELFGEQITRTHDGKLVKKED